MDAETVEEIVRVVREGAVETVSLGDGREFILTPAGTTLHDVSDAQRVRSGALAAIRQQVKLTAKHSFVAYMTAFKAGGSRVFADLVRARFVGAVDYHDPAAVGGSHVQHSATFELQESEEWKRWNSIDGKLMKQADFARWLEENLADIAAPEGADVLEVVRDMSAKKNVNFASAVRLANGDTSFEYVEETRAQSKQGHLDVPTMFVLKIPVFYGEPAVEQRAWLRWNIDSGQLAIGIQLYRPAYVRQAVFEQIALDITEGTQLPLHFGAMGS